MGVHGRFRARCLVVLALVHGVAAGPATAAGATDEAYAQGLAAFRQQEYAVAADRFERARGMGLRSGPLFYNLGSAYFRLGRLGEAESCYLEASGFPETQAMAWHHLGLLSARRGFWRSAERWFLRVTASKAPEPLKAQSRAAVARLQPQLRPRAHLRLNAGYNNNVVALSEVAPAPAAGEGSGFSELQFRYDSRRHELLGNHAEAQLALHSTQFSRLASANVLLAGGSLLLRRPDSWGNWNATLGAGTIFHGGARYRDSTLFAGAREFRWRELEARAAYELEDFEGLVEPDPGITGSRDALTLGGAYRIGQSRWSVGVGRERHPRAVRAFSFDRDHYRAGWIHQWPGGDSFSLHYVQYRSEFPSWAPAGRTDTLKEGSAEYMRRWGGGTYGLAALRHASNESGDPAFSYSQTVVFLGVGCDI